MNRNMGLKKCLIAVAVLLLGAGVAASVQGATLLHNGDFEDNTAVGSQYNLTNAAFSSAMAYATAFSTNYEELDILTSGNAIGIIAPQSGSWMVGLHQNTAGPNYIDAFSLALISPIVAGRTYELDFYAVGYSIGTLGPVEIGLPREIDHTHPALSDFLEDLETTQLLLPETRSYGRHVKLSLEPDQTSGVSSYVLGTAARSSITSWNTCVPTSRRSPCLISSACTRFPLIRRPFVLPRSRIRNPPSE